MTEKDEMLFTYLKMVAKKELHDYRIVLFGAGVVGQRMFNSLKDIGIDIVGFADNNKKIFGKRIEGKKVFSLEELLAFNEEFIWVVSVKDEKMKTDIAKQLKSNGAKKVISSLEELLFSFLLRDNELEKKPIFLFGAGKIGKKYVMNLERFGVPVEGFCDNSKSIIGTMIEGKIVFSLKEIKEKYKDVIWLISIKNQNIKREIGEELENNGYSIITYSISELLDKIGKPDLKSFFIEKYRKINSEDILSYIDFNKIGAHILADQQNEFSEVELKNKLIEFSYKPLISVLVPMYNPPMEWLPRVVESLQEQIYGNWELCISDDGSTSRDGVYYIKEMAKNESRIKLIENQYNRGISAASNAALNAAEGEFIALLDQDDELPKDALYWIVQRLNDKPEADFIYTDECKYNSKSSIPFFDFYLKPNWSPRLLMNHMYTGHLTVYRTSVVQAVGGFRSQFDFSQDYDLALRISEHTNNIEHIERILYYWRAIETSAATGAKDFARVSNMHALKEWFNRHNMNVMMQTMPRGNYGRVIKEVSFLVSIIIPTDNYENLRECIHGLMERTSYENIEIIPVTKSEILEDIKKEFAYLEGILRPCRFNESFNFSRKCNKGVEFAKGEVVIFYNDDVNPVSRDWIERLLDLLELPDVGSVSPMLTGPDGKIQYAGMITGTPGLIGTSFNGYMADNFAYAVFNHFILRDVSVLSGACCAMTKKVFKEVGGFDEQNTPNGHSDVDLSFKILENGYFNVYNPYARLIHLGNHTWHEKDKADKADIYCLKKWGKYLETDAFFTNSQKQMFYFDFLYQFNITFPDAIKNTDGKGKDVLFITHELSRTGAPIVLKEAVRITLDKGDFAIVLSYKDGPLKNEFLKMGVPVMIDEAPVKKHWMFERFARNFDKVIVNTIAAYHAVELLQNSLPNVYWWLHDGKYAMKSYKRLLPSSLSSNIKVLFAGRYVQQVMHDAGFDYAGEILQFGIQKEHLNCDKRTYSSNCLRFTFSGSYEERKGIDVLIKAIEMLPSDINRRCEFVLMGQPMYEDVFKMAEDFARQKANVVVSHSVTYEKAIEVYRDSYAIIVPSRDEPTSAVAVEAMMLGRPVICSDNTGISYFITQYENGLVFPSENSERLSELICWAVENEDNMNNIGRRGNQIWEEYFTIERFYHNFLEKVSDK